MGKRDELIALYAGELTSKCGVTPDMDLLTKVAAGESLLELDACFPVLASEPGLDSVV